jgi:L-ascorbate metabolism protein UlaG (beta-lactamase superfamily)
MIITNYGKQFFKVQLGDTTLAFNPIGKDSKIKASRFGADVALCSVNHPDYNGVDAVIYGEKDPLAITGPGEYETKGVFIKGVPTEAVIAGKKYINTIYSFELDSIKICFLGAYAGKQLPAVTKELIDDIDILFVAIDGNERVTPADAYALAISLEPKIIIPMDYDENAKALKTFLKEGDAEDVKPLDKYTIKKKDLEGCSGDIVVLDSQA